MVYQIIHLINLHILTIAAILKIQAIVIITFLIKYIYIFFK